MIQSLTLLQVKRMCWRENKVVGFSMKVMSNPLASTLLVVLRKKNEKKRKQRWIMTIKWLQFHLISFIPFFFLTWMNSQKAFFFDWLFELIKTRAAIAIKFMNWICLYWHQHLHFKLINKLYARIPHYAIVQKAISSNDQWSDKLMTIF